jgi:protein-disulfide isomerase
MTEPTAPRHRPAGATPDGDAIVVGGGAVRVDAYIDFLCPFCRRFEQSAGPALGRLVAEGRVSVAYHPMNFLDQASTTRYSTRAAAAAGCAADQGRFAEYAHALFANQPPEGGPGLTDEDLIRLGDQAGLPGGALAGCVSAGRYLGWPSYVTARAIAAGVESTPSVLIGGVRTRPEPEAITAAVTAAGRLG